MLRSVAILFLSFFEAHSQACLGSQSSGRPPLAHEHSLLQFATPHQRAEAWAEEFMGAAQISGSIECPWSGTTSIDNQLQCADGTLCFGWSCCMSHGGRTVCPPNKPQMCNSKTCGDGDYCCKESCDEYGGLRACSAPSDPSPSQGCAWTATTGVENQLECIDGTRCSGWTCCTMHGGRAKCPLNKPFMCNLKTCGGGDFCCKESCDDYGGLRTCPALSSSFSTPSPSPAQGCTWTSTTGVDNQLECVDGTRCSGWKCCTMHGGRAKCPSNKPFMCNIKTCGDGDFCCKESCDDYGGLRTCPALSSSFSTPSPSPAQGCTWTSTTGVENQLECVDGTRCFGWSCCTMHGGRAKCPPNKPLMCNTRACGDGDYCCKETCVENDGMRQCPGSIVVPLSILMIGNSYTFYNDGVDGMLRGFFATAGSPREVIALTRGGSNLMYHLEQSSIPGTPHHTNFMMTNRQSKPWGFVIVQDQSHVPALCCYTDPKFTDTDFMASVAALRELDKKIEAMGAQTVFYQTWGRRDGHASRSYLSTFVAMNDFVEQGYAYYASQVTKPGRTPLVAPVGRAFRLIYDEISSAGRDPADSGTLFNRLYDPDASHPSAMGTYLAACVLYSTISGARSAGLPAGPGISGLDAAFLQSRADQAVFHS